MKEYIEEKFEKYSFSLQIDYKQIIVFIVSCIYRMDKIKQSMMKRYVILFVFFL